MTTHVAYGLALGIGVIAGLRALTAPAAVSLAAHFKWMKLGGTALAFIGSTAVAVTLSILAIAEIVNDKLPKTPARTALPSFIVRIITGAFSGAAICLAARHSIVAGIVLGALGAIVGTLGGYHVRRVLVTWVKIPDFTVALVEDAVAIIGAFFFVSRF
ncbi:MAG: DUF4126 family protein [Candidatus Acidiferrales bacterium]